jgi:cobaltochelatase CobN
MEHDYGGAREMMKFVEYMWGWDVMTPEMVTDADWNRIYDVYINDKYEIGVDDFLRSENPAAYQSMTARMLEAVRTGYWDGSLDISAETHQEIMQTLISEYMESIVENGGMTCCHHTCGNPLLDEYLAGRISMLGLDIDQKIIDECAEIWEETTETESALEQIRMEEPETSTPSESSVNSNNGKGTYPPDWENVSDKTETSAGTSNETSEHIGGIGEDASRRANPSEGSESNYQEGQEMTVEKSDKFNTGLSFSGAPMIGMLLVIALMVIIYWGYRRRR